MVVLYSIHRLRNQSQFIKNLMRNAPFVYRLGRCPFKAERPVRFWYGVPFVSVIMEDSSAHWIVNL